MVMMVVVVVVLVIGREMHGGDCGVSIVSWW